MNYQSTMVDSITTSSVTKIRDESQIFKQEGVIEDPYKVLPNLNLSEIKKNINENLETRTTHLIVRSPLC